MIEPFLLAYILMRDLKGVGAILLQQGRTIGLERPQSLQRFEEAYQGFKVEEGYLSATYQIGFGVIKNV